MATGAPGTNGVWQYGEDDSEATFSALLNKAASTTDTQLGLDRTRLTTLELSGRIIQTVSVNYATQVTTTSDSYVTTGLTASITPRYSNSKIYVVVNDTCNPSGNGAFFTIFRNGTGGTNLGSGSQGFTYIYGATGLVTSIGMTILDSPATTSSTSYTLAFRANTAGQGQTAQYTTTKATITLLEVKG